jgi:tetratricopeptide (TPR) repeat protein
MDEFDRQILDLAQSYEAMPDAFIPVLEALLSDVDLEDKARFYFRAGELLNDNAHYLHSLKCWEMVLDYSLKVLEIPLQITCLMNIGDIYGRLGNYDQAVYRTKEAIALTRQIRDELGEAQAYGSLGLISENCGKLNAAAAYYEQSLATSKRIQDTEGELISCERLSEVHIRSGNFSEGINYVFKVLQLNDLHHQGEPSRKARCYISLVHAYGAIERYRKAIEYGDEAIEIATRIKDPVSLAKAYLNLGTIYGRLRQFHTSIAAFEKALGVTPSVEDPHLLLSCYLNTASAFRAANNLEEAAHHYTKAERVIEAIKAKERVEIWEQIKIKRAEFHYHTGVGVMCSQSGNLAQAAARFETALGISRDLEDAYGEAESYLNLGNVSLDRGDLASANDFYTNSIKLCQKIGNQLTEYACNVGLGRVHIDKDARCALDFFKAAIRMAENVATDLVDDVHVVGINGRVQDTYRYAITLCLKLDESEQAFEYLEASKSRGILALLSATDLQPTVELTRERKLLLKEEEECLIQLRSAQMRSLLPERVEASINLDKIREKLDSIYSEIENEWHDPEYVSLRRGKPWPLAQIQHTIASQNNSIAMVEYFVSHEGIFLFVIKSSTRKVLVEFIPFSVDRMEYVFRGLIENVTGDMNIAEVLSGLDVLVEPLSKHLETNQLIYFVPHGFLHYLPLHALKVNGSPIIKNNPVAYIYSASLLKLIKQKGRSISRTVASFGVDYKGNVRSEEIFEDEAKEVATLFGGECYLGAKATKRNVLEAMTEKDIVHLSCHGFFKPDDPLGSTVKLYGGESITARELFTSRVASEMVVLSACETGVNMNEGGDELIGLTRSLLYAGAHSVIVTLWKVHSQSARDIVVEFYKALKEGASKAAALQQAQVVAMTKNRDPQHWAPFVVIGDWN